MDNINYILFSDAELMELLKQSDHKAYTTIYNRYKGVLYVHAYKRLGDREEAQDVIQELFTVLWNNRNEIQISTGLAGYLYSAVRNRVIKVISHKHVESSYIGFVKSYFQSSSSVTDHLIREKMLTAIIENEIDQLPVKMREIFQMSRKEHLSHKEIAEILDLSESTVKKQVSNALKILRGKLGLAFFLYFLYKN